MAGAEIQLANAHLGLVLDESVRVHLDGRIEGVVVG